MYLFIRVNVSCYHLLLGNTYLPHMQHNHNEDIQRIHCLHYES